MSDKYLNSSQQTLMAVVEALAVDPLTPKALSTLVASLSDLELSQDKVFRTLKNLEMNHWAEQSGDAWMISPAITRIAERMRIAIHNTHHHYLDEK